ncbi:MAG TPA: hypothetical protein VFC00_30370 [Micromonosporaceae bacterium]|nr:hypothetical protein [Micromonosporaceae bacterium]
MTDRHAELDAALERVIGAARDHLAAVKAADGRVEDNGVWRAYVALNNASYEYDELLLDVFGEVTPWDVEAIDPDEADRQVDLSLPGDEVSADDPYPHVVSVRQRRDYRVPSVSALLRTADLARADAAQVAGPVEDDEPVEPVTTVGEAVLELLQTGDGSLSSLDVPQLEPLDGLVTVVEVSEALDLEAYAETDGSAPFQLAAGDRLVGRLDEHPYTEDVDELDDEEGEYDELDSDSEEDEELDDTNQETDQREVSR